MTGIEAAIASTTRPGQRALVLNNGRFAERCTTILQRYGCMVDEIVVPWGETITAEQVAQKLAEIRDVHTVWITHSETSTAVTVDLAAIAKTIRSFVPNALICVDAVTSLAVHAVETDAWDLDVVVTGIQKGLMCPPGLACVALRERATSSLSTQPRSYTLDLPTILRAQQRQQFAWTPPVTLIAGLDAAITLLLERGMEEVWATHQRVADHLRAQLRTMGLHLFGAATSNAVTAFTLDHANEVKDRLLRHHSMVVAGGQDRLNDTILRIGTCGPYTTHDMDVVCSALASVLEGMPRI